MIYFRKIELFKSYLNQSLEKLKRNKKNCTFIPLLNYSIILLHGRI